MGRCGIGEMLLATEEDQSLNKRMILLSVLQFDLDNQSQLVMLIIN